VMDALRAGDHVGAFRRAAEAGMRDDALARARSALSARGRAIESIDIDGVDELREVIHLARDLFAGEPLWGVPNLSLVPELPYYTGVVFEALHPKSGFPIAAGGRYDLLLGAFGTPRRATGRGPASRRPERRHRVRPRASGRHRDVRRARCRRSRRRRQGRADGVRGARPRARRSAFWRVPLRRRGATRRARALARRVPPS